MKIAALVVCLGFTVALTTPNVAASVIYDNYTYPQAPSGTGIAFPFGYDGSPVWDSFTSPDTEKLASLSVVLANVPEGNPLTTLQIGLFQDNATSPGSLITNIVSVTADHLSGKSLSDDPDYQYFKAYSFSLDTHPLVQAGTRYWIGILDDAGGLWCYTGETEFSVGVTGEYFANPDVHLNSGSPYEMRLTGDAVITTTPEPGTAGLLLFVTGTLGLFTATQRSYLKFGYAPSCQIKKEPRPTDF